MKHPTPTSAVKHYLAAACEGNAKAMRSATQRSYNGAGANGLRNYLTGFRVMRELNVEDSDVMRDVVVRLKGPAGEMAPDPYRIRCVCEDREGRPTPDGSWGVNPASVRAIKAKGARA